jgi:hypothetical protein
MLDEYAEVLPGERARAIVFGLDYDRAIFCESVAHDDAYRDAIRAHLEALAALAERQVRRSGQTARRRFAGRYDRAAHAWDIRVATTLRELLAASRSEAR